MGRQTRGHAGRRSRIQGHRRVEPARPHASRCCSVIVNPIALVQAFVRSNDQAAENLGMAMAFLPVLGLDNLKAIGGSVQLGTEEFDSEWRLQVYLDREASGVLKVLTFPATKQTPPKWVTEDSSSYIGINWDVPKAYTAIEGLADQIMGPGATAQKLDEWAAEDSLNIHLKKDVIDNLDGVIHITSDNPDPNKPQTARFLVALGIKNAKKMKAVLDKLSKLPNFQAEARDFKGEVIYNLAAPGLAQFGNSQPDDGRRRRERLPHVLHGRQPYRASDLGRQRAQALG